LRDRFPVHFRWAEILNAPDHHPKKAVFAEVFWADLSDTRQGIWDLVVRLFTLVFHLRFLADRGADLQSTEEGGAQTSLPARLLRCSLFIACWLLCGPIAALTSLLLCLLVANSGLQRFLKWQESNLGLLGLGAVALGLSLVWVAYKPRIGSQPWRRLFWGAAGASGFVITSPFLFAAYFQPGNSMTWLEEIVSLAGLAIGGIGCLCVWLSCYHNGGESWKNRFWRPVGFAGFAMALTFLPRRYEIDSWQPLRTS
jgi:hypothetical protein